MFIQKQFPEIYKLLLINILFNKELPEIYKLLLIDILFNQEHDI